MSFFSWRNWSWENQCICAAEGNRSKTSLGTGVKILTSRPAFNFWLSGSLWTYLLYFLLMLKLLSPCFTHAAYTATQMHTHTLFPLCLPSALYPSHIYPQCCELGRISHYSCSTIFFLGVTPWWVCEFGGVERSPEIIMNQSCWLLFPLMVVLANISLQYNSWELPIKRKTKGEGPYNLLQMDRMLTWIHCGASVETSYKSQESWSQLALSNYLVWLGNGRVFASKSWGRNMEDRTLATNFEADSEDVGLPWAVSVLVRVKGPEGSRKRFMHENGLVWGPKGRSDA